MKRLFMADDAVVSRRQAGPEVAPRAVKRDPVSPVASRRRLAMAPDTEVLLVARKAALPVSFSHEPMAQSPPGVRVVARRLRVVTRNAIRFS
jgi:hypothetical protein